MCNPCKIYGEFITTSNINRIKLYKSYPMKENPSYVYNSLIFTKCLCEVVFECTLKFHGTFHNNDCVVIIFFTLYILKGTMKVEKASFYTWYVNFTKIHFTVEFSNKVINS